MLSSSPCCSSNDHSRESAQAPQRYCVEVTRAASMAAHTAAVSDAQRLRLIKDLALGALENRGVYEHNIWSLELVVSYTDRFGFVKRFSVDVGEAPPAAAAAAAPPPAPPAAAAAAEEQADMEHDAEPELPSMSEAAAEADSSGEASAPPADDPACSKSDKQPQLGSSRPNSIISISVGSRSYACSLKAYGKSGSRARQVFITTPETAAAERRHGKRNGYLFMADEEGLQQVQDGLMGVKSWADVKRRVEPFVMQRSKRAADVLQRLAEMA
ncbi:hypothetical protein OEZ85_004828 [Tetradesmus obliquus]|uniref:Uncharacterized protein n=1 Tax=Tetradesmus obliquus TaxID=3088 RepID=A0ABY8UGC7_TETOB|nr:hypothetical protein OEZ85_004828 [Tetradesmus obliquus]